VLNAVLCLCEYVSMLWTTDFFVFLIVFFSLHNCSMFVVYNGVIGFDLTFELSSPC